jgi:hypothetical protein
MGRVHEAATQWEVASRLLDAKAAAIGDSGSLQSGIDRALYATAGARAQETGSCAVVNPHPSPRAIAGV